MFRSCLILTTMVGAITLAPALLSQESSVVRADDWEDDWEDYWEDVEDAREDYYEDLRKRDRRYWRHYRKHHVPGRIYYRVPAPVYYYPARPYGTRSYYYRPDVSVRVGGFHYGYWR